MKKLIILLSLTFVFAHIAIAQKTEIWIVRHAEKDKRNPTDTNPGLSAEGTKRASDLVTYLAGIRFDKGFSTAFNRTRQTLAPLMKATGIDTATYTNVKLLAAQIRKDYKGKTIIIAGHSNTILETIEAFGIKRPKEAITEDEFNYIFHITLNGNSATVKTDTYGAGS